MATALPAALSVAPVPSVPGIEVRADHHHFIALGVAGNLGDDVEGIRVVVEELGLDVEGELDGELVIEQPRDAVIVLGGEHDGGDVVLGVAVRAQAEDGAGVAFVGRADHQRHAFVFPKLIEALAEFAGLLRRERRLPVAAVAVPEARESGRRKDRQAARR